MQFCKMPGLYKRKQTKLKQIHKNRQNKNDLTRSALPENHIQK